MARSPPISFYRYILLLCTPVLLVVIGTVGYWLLEPDYTLFDALYMTVITLTTVGYGETHPLHQQGQVFTIILLLGGVITFFFATTEIIRGIVSGELHTLLGKQLMEQNLAAMKQHIIICGYGRIGRSVCEELVRQKASFVLIERNEEIIRNFQLPLAVGLAGDATADEVLKKAGIDSGACPDHGGGVRCRQPVHHHECSLAQRSVVHRSAR